MVNLRPLYSAIFSVAVVFLPFPALGGVPSVVSGQHLPYHRRGYGLSVLLDSMAEDRSNVLLNKHGNFNITKRLNLFYRNQQVTSIQLSDIFVANYREDISFKLLLRRHHRNLLTILFSWRTKS